MNLEESYSYNFIYNEFSRIRIIARKLMILLVGAGRFERPTPCAQGGMRDDSKMACFQVLRFQANASISLRLVEAY